MAGSTWTTDVRNLAHLEVMPGLFCGTVPFEVFDSVPTVELVKVHMACPSMLSVRSLREGYISYKDQAVFVYISSSDDCNVIIVLPMGSPLVKGNLCACSVSYKIA